jgi:predicted metal-dependent hydrolase
MSIALDGIPIAVETTDSNRKARLIVESDGSLSLRAATDVTEEELQQFVNTKRNWVYDKLAIKHAPSPDEPVKELVNGEGFTYLGRNYRLRLVDSAEPPTLRNGRLTIGQSVVASGDGAKAIIGWYETRGLTWIKPRAKDWARRLRVAPTGLQIANLGHKWGSRTPDGRIRLHWATFQLPVPLVEYVLAHELVHLLVPNHSEEFWTTLTRAMPDGQLRKAELAKSGATIWLGAVDPKGAIHG